ncbi:MAG: hypothetical protein WED15_03635 [Akkermansiaceae bacterium]
MSDTPFDRDHFEAVLADFVEENPLACQGLLSVARTVFTRDVPTLAVTLRDDPPLLLVNPDFIAAHVRSEDDLRALLLHEFLHVLLGHTKLFKKNNPATNLALDAVINHIVQRELGEDSGAFFRRFYQPGSDDDPLWLLRPHAAGDIRPRNEDAAKCAAGFYYEPRTGDGLSKAVIIHQLRRGLATARVLADDVLDLFDSLNLLLPEVVQFLGCHEEDEDIHPANRARLDRLLKELDGDGVFKRPLEHGIGAPPAAREWAAVDPHRRWRAATSKILRRLLVPDPRSRPVPDGLISYCLPVATSSDRRAALRALWNPILPDFQWAAEGLKPGGRANVYLDVSGSMSQELDLLIGLLWNLRQWIRSPFYAFSNGVYPARIVDGKLRTSTTGGTCFNDVLEHLIKDRPGKSMIITDGYIETPCPDLLRQLRTLGEEIHVLVSSEGTSEPFEKYSIPCTRLPRILTHANS